MVKISILTEWSTTFYKKVKLFLEAPAKALFALDELGPIRIRDISRRTSLTNDLRTNHIE